MHMKLPSLHEFNRLKNRAIFREKVRLTVKSVTGQIMDLTATEVGSFQASPVLCSAEKRIAS